MTKKKTKDEQLEHAYYAGFVRLWATRMPHDTTEKEFAQYIAKKFGVDEEKFTEFQQIKKLEFELMDDDDKEEYRLKSGIVGKVYPKPDWAVDRSIRTDWGGTVEDTCEHGVGHPNIYWLERKTKLQEKSGKDPSSSLGTHGCDGCCHDGTSTPTMDDDNGS